MPLGAKLLHRRQSRLKFGRPLVPEDSDEGPRVYDGGLGVPRGYQDVVPLSVLDFLGGMTALYPAWSEWLFPPEL